MHWNSIGEFFSMGGYALYVWGSFGACAVALTAEPFLVCRRLNAVRRHLAREKLAEDLDKNPNETPS